MRSQWFWCWALTTIAWQANTLGQGLRGPGGNDPAGAGKANEPPSSIWAPDEDQAFPYVVERYLYPVFYPAEPITVQLAVTLGVGVLEYALDETVPAGWQVSEVSDGGSFDPANRRITWGPFYYSAGRTVSYQLLPPGSPPEELTLSGTGLFDGVSVATTGSDTALRVGVVKLKRPVVDGNRFRFLLRGEPWVGYIVESSVDLATWQEVGEVVTGEDGAVQIVDADAGAGYDGALRFYRARTVE